MNADELAEEQEALLELECSVYPTIDRPGVMLTVTAVGPDGTEYGLEGRLGRVEVRRLAHELILMMMVAEYDRPPADEDDGPQMPPEWWPALEGYLAELLRRVRVGEPGHSDETSVLRSIGAQLGREPMKFTERYGLARLMQLVPCEFDEEMRVLVVEMRGEGVDDDRKGS